jgi:hypothetical protein
MKLTRFATGSVQGFGKIKSSEVFQGAYFWSSSSDNNLNQWWNLKSWWVDGARTRAASKLPKSDTDVVIVAGSVAPYLSLDREGLVQPQSINAGTVGLTAHSDTSAPLTCSITVTSPPAAITLAGNATYNF